MKKVLTVAAAAGLIALAACNTSTGNNTADAMIENHEANASAYDDMSANATNSAAANAFANASAVEENKADAIQANATNASSNSSM